MTVDGYDPIAVYETTSQAVEHARSGRGPVFIEAMTYRLFGHMVGDTEPYRTKEEVAQWRAKDPITTFPQRLDRRVRLQARPKSTPSRPRLRPRSRRSSVSRWRARGRT